LNDNLQLQTVRQLLQRLNEKPFAADHELTQLAL